ncbi:MAG: anti-sigma factor [Nocardioides sp.]|uniref:anti-sigma factor n=1 Tax=Nocardioides sp. TaxID=35761 RepID=UPI0039E3FAA4
MSGDIHALSGAYAVDALEPPERAEFERHLAECESCRAEVAGLRETAAMLAETTATPPPAALRDRLMADAATVRPLAPHLPIRGRAETGRSRGRPRRRWAAIVAVAAVLATGAVVWQPWTEPSSHHVALVDRVVHASDVVRTRVRAGTGEVTVYRSASLGRAAIVAPELHSPPTGHVYELWLQDAAGQMQPAGLTRTLTTPVLVTGSTTAAVGIGITVEPVGGSTHPTTDPLALVTF